MRLNIRGVEFEILGDPHMGRRFRNNVPFHRLGDREKMQRADLQASLADVDGVDAHICMGDLFDKAKVDNRVVAETADDYLKAARTNVPPYIVLTGNHDELKDRDYVSSFQLFTRIVDQDIYVVRSKPFSHLFDADVPVHVVFIPWHPLKTAREMVEEYAELIRGADAVFGHWDVDRRLEGTENYCPADLFAQLDVGLIVTGHDHVAREMTLSGVKVIVTGSMQPYSHSEDPHRKLYATCSANDVRSMLDLRPNYFTNTCLRIIGEWDDPIPDCLQFKVVPENMTEADEALAEVQLADFSMKDLWAQAFDGIDPEINQTLAARFAELGGEDE